MIALVCAVLAVAEPSSAPASAPVLPDTLSVRVLTFGPGEHPFFKFGHNAIWIHDEATHRDPVYNYGTFGFDSPWLILDFLKGRFVYWLSVDDIRGTIYAYQSDNRSVFAQELDLSPEQKRALSAALEENAKPENAKYKYDYYRDNCSTRIRDAVDRVSGGVLHEASRAPAALTFRGHTLRLTASLLYEYVGLDLLLSNPIDKPVDQWAEMFLPQKLQESLRRAHFADGRPLVKSERLLVPSRAEVAPETPPDWHLWFFLAGTLAAALMLVTARFLPRVHGVLLALMGFKAGLLGTIFTLIWFFTNHDFSWHNENILQCAPWAFMLVGSGFKLALGRPAPRALFWSRVVLTSAALGLVLKILPWFDQSNWREIVLFLPLWIGVERSLAWRARA